MTQDNCVVLEKSTNSVNPIDGRACTKPVTKVRELFLIIVPNVYCLVNCCFLMLILLKQY